MMHKIVLLFASDLDVYNKKLLKIIRAYQSRDFEAQIT